MLFQKQIIECSGSMREMGQQYGEAAKEFININVELFNKKYSAQDKNIFGAMAIDVLSRKLPDVMEELRGISEGSGLPLNDIVLINQMPTFGESWLDEQCTPVCITDSPDGGIVAKNNDGINFFEIGMKYAYVIRKTKPNKGIPMLQLTYAGWLSGMDAMNAEGLANMHGSVGSRFDKSGPRVDVRLAIYQLMSTCRTTQEFSEGLMDYSLTGKGFSIIACDKSGTATVVEAAVPLIHLRPQGKSFLTPADKEFLFSTNMFMHPELRDADMRSPAMKEIANYRFGYLRWREKYKKPQNVDDIKGILSSHEPWAPCRHGGPDTEWSMIAIPKKGKVLIAKDSPCKVNYEEYQI